MERDHFRFSWLLAVDGSVPGVVGLSRFLRERAGTAAILIYFVVYSVICLGDYEIKKRA
jgi:hypothetical protein